jgi:hypothetical protein
MIVFSLIGIASVLFVWLGDPGNVYALTREDGVVENLSALFYVIGFIVSFISIFKNERKHLPIIWAVLCFIFLGEETSWFQRVFHYSVPLVEQNNAQNEFNIHNMKLFHGGNLANFDLSSLLKSQNLFRLGFISYFLGIPLLLYISWFKELMSRINYKKPDSSFTLGLLVVFALSIFLTLFSHVNVKSAMAETREMLYAFFIMLYIIAYLWPNKSFNADPKHTGFFK